VSFSDSTSPIDVENTAFEGLVHLVQLFQKAVENPAFNDGLAVLGIPWPRS